MAKEMVYFNATKQIETITVHYNEKLDGSFVDDVSRNIKEIAKKMSKVDLKNPKEFEAIQVFVYPSKQLFYKVFAGEIEKRFYSRRRSLEDLYVVRDSEGHIHIVSPRGMNMEKRDAFKKILVMKVLGEYMDEKQKQSAERLLKEAMKPKQKKEEEQEIEEEQEELEEEIEEIEELEDEELEALEEELEAEQEEEELSEEELDEIIETEQAIEQIDDEQLEDEPKQDKEDEKAKKESSNDEPRQWLNIGWLAYVRGRLKKEKDVKRFADNISKKGVKKLSKLSKTKLFEDYNYSEEYACAMVEYVVETYGMKKFTEFYENPKDIKGVFGISKFVFESQMKAFIYSRYTYKEMKMEMDQKDVKEITEIHFASGGADITTDKELSQKEQSEIKEKI